MRYLIYCASCMLVAGCAATTADLSPGGPADPRAGDSALPMIAQINLDAPATQPAAAQLYACPMHQLVVQDHPGKCPICGMTLEPKAGAK